MADIKKYLSLKQQLIEKSLCRFLSEPANLYPLDGSLSVKGIKLINRAMKYSVLGGGKRLRPVLCMAAAEACAGKPRNVIPCACGLELIHAYSLIHDDLPAMDDDTYRRGKLTNHKIFGEATAILAGDALLTYGFELISRNAKIPGTAPKNVLEALHIASVASGWKGLIAGQVVDLLCEKTSQRKVPAGHTVNFIHRHKTAALIAASVECGCVLSGASARERIAIRRYGDNIGISFQIIDDVLDVTGNEKKMGKRHSDDRNGKLTFPKVHGVEESKRIAARLVEEAKDYISPFGDRALALQELADYIVYRDR